MTIEIEDLTFDAIIGILSEERETPQKVIVNVELNYEYKKDIFINYATLANLIKNDIQNSKYLLIEDALLNLHVKIKTEFSQISSIKLKISKPTIIDQCVVSVSSIVNY
jgi:dihydroneopterin aldolase